jgi:preprotein translocase subunit YajC
MNIGAVSRAAWILLLPFLIIFCWPTFFFIKKKKKKKKPKINFPENRIKAETLHLFIFKLKTQN